MTSIILSLFFIHLLKRAWKNDRVKSEIFFKLHFRSGQMSQMRFCLIKLKHSYIVRNFLRLEIVMFDNNFA